MADERKMAIPSRKRRVIYYLTKRIIRRTFAVCHQRCIWTFAIHKMIFVFQILIKQQKWIVFQRLTDHSSIERARLIIQAFARMVVTKQNCHQIRCGIRKKIMWESSIIICSAVRRKMASNKVAQMKFSELQLERLKEENKTKQAIHILQKYVRTFLATLHLEKVVTERMRSTCAIKIQLFYKMHSEIKKKRKLVAKEFIALALQRKIRKLQFLEKETKLKYHATFIQSWWKKTTRQQSNVCDNGNDKTTKKSSAVDDDRNLKPLHETFSSELPDKPCSGESVLKPDAEASSTLNGMRVKEEPSMLYVAPIKESHNSHERVQKFERSEVVVRRWAILLQELRRKNLCANLLVSAIRNFSLQVQIRKKRSSVVIQTQVRKILAKRKVIESMIQYFSL